MVTRRAQINLESYFEELSKIEEKDTLIICDRGACDTFAYCGPDIKNKVLASQGWDLRFLNYGRYDKVIHMVTAAKGAEAFYNLGNAARSESKDDAVELDRRLQGVWFEHPQFQIVDNSGVSFVEKIGLVFDEISSLISLPVEKFVRKFLLKGVFARGQFPAEVAHSGYRETVIYLPRQEPGSISFVIRRHYEVSGRTIYRLKTRSLSGDVEKRVETSRQLTLDVFKSFYVQRDQSRKEVQKDCFVFRMEEKEKVFLYKIETFLGGESGGDFSVLHLTSSEGKSERKYPSFVEVDREVTSEPEFFSHVISKRRGESGVL